MDPAAIAAIAELAKLGLVVYISYMRQAGLTDEQIDSVFKSAKEGLLIRDPAKIPG
jgi:hypothetical protein